MCTYKEVGAFLLKLNEVRKETSIKAKNGIGFLLAAIVIWTIITVIFLLLNL
ncbi:DUF7010 family protein [Gracilibacillus phocaeensis]|uniref:DUF7010 family protein n=1 Tax=Gracilibacillus phocaeensis TaxID=2042304 RepID=UPI0013EEF5E9|nr:hypothetical protein [Gracilibacillus phocaeensis]